MAFTMQSATERSRNRQDVNELLGEGLLTAGESILGQTLVLTMLTYELTALLAHQEVE